MILSKLDFSERRKRLKKQIQQKRSLRFIGSFSPLVSRLIEEKGFDGIYVSGAMISSLKALPDIGLTTLQEVSTEAENIMQSTSLPSLVDADTGFGQALNCARAVREMEKRGLSGLHIEDQEFPKRCGHLDHKKLIPLEDMVKKIRACTKAREDKDFLIIARTDAFSLLGMKEAVLRAQAYQEAGADVIFPEALPNLEAFEEFRQKVEAPLLANMTEFGKTDIISYKAFEELGYNIVIYPVSTWRIALNAVEKGLDSLYQDKQKELLPQMQTRERLYELLRYKDYNTFDEEAFNFKLKKTLHKKGK